jgi:hypothetical protein
MAISIRMDNIGVVRVDEEEDIFEVIRGGDAVQFALQDLDRVVTALIAIRAVNRPLAYRL